MYPPGLQISNRFQALNDEDEPNLCPVDKQWTSGRITVDSGAAESVWPEGFMPEMQTKPSVGSQTGVTKIAASGNRMPNLLREEGPLQDEGRPELQHCVPSDQSEEAPRSRVQDHRERELGVLRTQWSVH